MTTSDELQKLQELPRAIEHVGTHHERDSGERLVETLDYIADVLEKLAAHDDRLGSERGKPETRTMSDEPFYVPNRTPAPPRQPKPVEEVWRLRHPHGRVQHCELRHDGHAGAGWAEWDVMVLEAGELLFSRRYASEALARFAAEAVRQDLARTGWVRLSMSPETPEV